MIIDSTTSTPRCHFHWRNTQAIAVALFLHSPALSRAADPPASSPTEEETAAADTDTKPARVANWVKPVPGWVPVKPGEHPRLLFRKSDLPGLKKRAQTPEGKAIIMRLKETLGGGEAMPTIFNPAKTSYNSDSASSPELKKEGAYTIGHAAGFGFLYQLTGDKKYADLSRQCVELAMKGQRDRDDRYSLIGYANDAQLRAAPTLGTYAMAYDFCYDAWPEDFRKQFVETLMTANADMGCDLKSMAIKPRHMPTSNHWGSEIGGIALSLLAINGDPGVDQAFVDKALPITEKNLEKLFVEAWGGAGWFSESTGPSHVSSNSAIMPALQAFQVALGKDYTDRPSVRWMTMRWAYDIFPKNGKPWYACRQISGNRSYGTEDFLSYGQGGGISHGGWFSQGFGVIPEADKPALLWTYQNFVAKAMQDDYDIRNYPHRAVLSFLNWPIGMTPKNPGEILPKVRFDSMHGYVSFRNQWKDEGDIVVSAWTGIGPRGWIGRSGMAKPGMDHGNACLWAYGQKVDFGNMAGSEAKVIWTAPDGSGLFTNGKRSLAVDFSKRAGVDALIVSENGPASLGLDARIWKVSDNKTILDTKRLYIASLSKSGIHPIAIQDKTGNRIIVGGQTIVLENGNITFKPLDGVAAGMGEKTLDANAALSVILAKLSEEEKRNAVPRAEVVLPADPPVLSFTFEKVEGEGGKQVFRDSGPNKLVAEVKGKPVKVEDGIMGKAALLNGLDNALVIPPNPAVDMPGKSITISCWFKNDSSEPGSEVVLLEKNHWQGGKAPDCYSLCIDSGGTFGFNTFSAGNHPRSEIPWNDGGWHHLVSVFDTQEKSIAIYHNGKQIKVMKPLKGTARIGEGSAPLTMGARNAAKPSALFGGLLDEVVMYDRALTRGEVQALYEKGVPPGEAGKPDPKSSGS